MNNSERNRHWIHNYIASVLTKGKKDRNIWIFSCWEGKRYADNTRYLFEYVSDNRKDIECYWFSSDPDVVSFVENNGRKACLIGSPKAKEIQRKCGVVFYTNGLDDFGEQIYCYNAFVVSLWHGVGFKKVYATLPQQGGSLKQGLKKLKVGMFDYAKRDLTIATSAYSVRNYSWEFNVPADTISITGLPRNDIYRYQNRDRLLENYGLSKDKKYILYMPTYRKKIDINSIVESLSQSKMLAEVLSKNDYVLLCKLHPLSKANFMETEVIRDFTNAGGSPTTDTQELLCMANILITDYSSVISDYALTNNPVIIYAPDYNEYKCTPGLYDEIEQMTASSNFAMTVEELIHSIMACVENPEDNLDITGIVNDICTAKEIRGTCYSQNVYEKVVDILKNGNNK